MASSFLKKLLFNILRVFVTGLLLFFIFKTINIEGLLLTLNNIKYEYFLLGLSYFIIYPLIGIERWRHMISFHKSLWLIVNKPKRLNFVKVSFSRLVLT